MKSFKIQSPCYRANGLNGTYYSIALTDDNGDIIKGFGDHISENSYGVKNVFEAEGKPFSDEDRFISITEIQLSENDFDLWLDNYNKSEQAIENWSKIKEDKFGNTYDFLYKSSKNKQEENEKIYNVWMSENPYPKTVSYYDFLRLINEN